MVQEAVATLVGDLVDPDAPQSRQAVHAPVDVGPDPSDDGPHRAPRHPQYLDDGALGDMHRQPRRLVIEVAGMPSAVTGPGNLRHRRTVSAAPHPGRVGLDEHPGRAQIQRPPSSPALTAVIARRLPTAAPAPPPSSRRGPCRDHDRISLLIEEHVLHHRARQPEGALPYAPVPHPALPPVSKPSSSSKPKKQTGCNRG